MSDVHGILVVDKPVGPTSHDVVAGARRLYGTRRVGHAGTLDPLASGVLVLLFGEACKLGARLTAAEKTYRARISFGRSTDTLDAEGRATEERAVAAGTLEGERFDRALDAERARTLQLPPAVSAIKVRGQRAHRLARRGEAPELQARAVSVRRLEVVARGDDWVEVEATVSKGYYVRALARDLAAGLGVPGHLGALRRLASGDFSLDEACAWPLAEPTPLTGVTEAARRALPTALLRPEGVGRARTGLALGAEDFSVVPPAEGVAAWIAPEGQLVALGEATEPGRFRVVRGFNAP